VATNLLLDATVNSSMTPPLSLESEVVEMQEAATGYFGETRDLASLVEATSYATLLCDVAGRIVQISGTPELVFGFDRGGLSQQSVLGAIPSDTQQEFIEGFNTCLGGHTPAAIRYSKPAPWGGTLQVELSLNPLLEAGAVVGVQARGVEQSLITLINAVFAGDFDTAVDCANEAPTVVYFLDGNGQCTSMNDRWSLLSGQSTEDALGVGFLARVPDEAQARFRATAAAAHAQRSGWRLQFPVLTAGETLWHVDTASASVGRPDGSILGYVGIITPFSTTLAALLASPAMSPSTSSSASPQHVAAHATAVETVTPTATETHVQAPLSEPDTQQLSEALTSEEPNLVVATDTAPQHVQVPHDISTLESNSPGDRQWSAPALKEGFTDPSFLATPQKSEIDPDASITAAAPGVDKVTGLSNRLLFAQGVASTVGRMQADALTVSVSFIDLHGLETIRQSFGARSTNDYLFLLARRLESTIRSIESCGRIDGDVLGVLSVNWLFAEDLPIVAQRLLTRLQEPLAGKDGGELIVSMDLGMAVARPGEHVNDVFARAWESLQRSKADPDNKWQIDYGV
jgi:diguanylate cyclase (GGDEF)-like protein